MLDVYICEDTPEQLVAFEKTVKDIIMIEEYDMKVKLSTKDPYELLEILTYSENTGIYFLDVDLKSDINGLELATKIRNLDPRGFIIFITVHSEMAYLTFQYKAEAFDFIIKDKFKKVKERIHECLVDVNERQNLSNVKAPKAFTIKVKDKVINELYDNILFFEISPNIHKVIMHAKNRQVEFYAILKDIEKNLDQRFYRCKDSVIVNKDLIKEIDKKNRIIYMINGEKCDTSTRLIKGLLISD